ncbi:DDE-type integrase/transposase/recombinase [Abyssogena phaseoliformis symbiont]|uniref:DDE-type integrase/transposase/recombinase n=1 Tax=Abyssogena phaseoliformis symbiont TaxID=596095 RepID=UPI001916C341|nr:DDE-type integrase/transposase/recombinase [Abyssogena phaseoliformis symbiont]
MNSKQLVKELNVGLRHVQKLTARAKDSCTHVVEYGNKRYTIAVIEGVGGCGKVYEYEKVVTLSCKPKRRVSSGFNINPRDLPVFSNINKPTSTERLDLVRFINTTRHPISHIAQFYYSIYDTTASPLSLSSKFKRWVKLFKKQDASALNDKHSSKEFKTDLNLVEQAIVAMATKHYTNAFSEYCLIYADKHDLNVDFRNLGADISESSFKRSVHYPFKIKLLLKDYLHLSMEYAFTYAEPSFGRKWAYANEQWKIDATPLDIMCKVPHIGGVRDYTNKIISDNYHLVHPQLIAIVDNKTGARVSAVFQSSNTYSNLRLLYKAFQKLGIPEVIKGDNGADYVSEHIQGVLEYLSINYIRTGKAKGDQKAKLSVYLEVCGTVLLLKVWQVLLATMSTNVSI